MSNEFEELIGKDVTLFCVNMIYTGTLVAATEHSLKLKDPSIIYETGPFNDKKWKDEQPLPHKHWYVRTSVVESYGILK